MKNVLKIFFSNIFIVIFIASCSFFLIHLIPGDPVDFILKDGANQQEKEILKKELGLNRPIVNQYFSYLKNLFSLQLGSSLYSYESVFFILKENIPFSFNLAIITLFFSLLWGLSLGLVSVFYKPFKKQHLIFELFPVLFFSIPAFVVAPLLIWLLAIRIPLFPVGGSGHFVHLLLPALSLALPLGAILMKITRASVLEVIHLPYVRTAQAKGLSPFKIYFYHVLRNALIPIVTISGLQMGTLLTGTVIIEIIFDRPGVGNLLYQSIVSRDYPLIQISIFFIALVYVFVNRFTDWLYIFIQPQIRKV